MKVKFHYSNRDILTTDGGARLYRRFRGTPPIWPVVWQERLHTGEFYNVSGPEVTRLESLFQSVTVEGCAAGVLV